MTSPQFPYSETQLQYFMKCFLGGDHDEGCPQGNASPPKDTGTRKQQNTPHFIPLLDLGEHSVDNDQEEDPPSHTSFRDANGFLFHAVRDFSGHDSKTTMGSSRKRKRETPLSGSPNHDHLKRKPAAPTVNPYDQFEKRTVLQLYSAREQSSSDDEEEELQQNNFRRRESLSSTQGKSLQRRDNRKLMSGRNTGKLFLQRGQERGPRTSQENSPAAGKETTVHEADVSHSPKATTASISTSRVSDTEADPHESENSHKTNQKQSTHTTNHDTSTIKQQPPLNEPNQKVQTSLTSSFTDESTQLTSSAPTPTPHETSTPSHNGITPSKNASLTAETQGYDSPTPTLSDTFEFQVPASDRIGKHRRRKLDANQGHTTGNLTTGNGPKKPSLKWIVKEDLAPRPDAAPRVPLPSKEKRAMIYSQRFPLDESMDNTPTPEEESPQSGPDIDLSDLFA